MRWTLSAFFVVWLALLGTLFFGWIYPDGLAPMLGHWPKTGWLSVLLNNLFVVSLKANPLNIHQPLTWVILVLLIAMLLIINADMKLRKGRTHGSANHAGWARSRRQYRSPRGFAFASALPKPTPRQNQRRAIIAMRPRLFSRQKPEQRLILGRYKGFTTSLSQQQQQENALLAAPIGAGKTALVIVRNLLREIGLRSLFIADVKAELVRLCAGYLSQYYTVWVFAPGKPDESNGYNPLAHVHAVRDAQALADCWIMNTGTSKNDDFWMKATRRLFIAAILHLRATEPHAPFSRLAELLSSMTYKELKNVLTRSPQARARSEALAAFDSMDKNEKMAGGILADMGTRFDLLMDDEVAKTTSYNDIDFRRMAEKPIALFLSIPPRDIQRCRPLMACFTMQMFSEWEARAEQERTGQLPLPVECYLDEFANLGNIYGLSGYLTTMRHIGVGLLIVLQSFAQLDERYGAAVRKTILTNCTTHLLLPGSGLEECEYYSARIGDTTVPTTSQTSTGSGFFTSTHSYTTGETRRRLFTPDELRTMERRTMMVLGSSADVMMVQTTPWYQDRETRDRGNMPFVPGTHVDVEPEDGDPQSWDAGVPRAPLPGPKSGPGGNTGCVVDADLPPWRGSGFTPE
ncbi:MAG: type IV secretory system conjugative DNA transfer family protein [Ktedonobacteraceae bacterium]